MQSSIRAVLVGIAYIVIGAVFAALSGGASSPRAVVGWRLAAWVASVILFGWQIFYEITRVRNSPRSVALYAAFAAAIGGFGLAISALIHRHGAGSHTNYFAFLVWPVVIFIPAFIVAWIFAAIIASTARSKSP